jgi:hypothetical protein
VGPLKLPPVVLLDTGAVLTVTGTLTNSLIGGSLHGNPLHSHPVLTGAWIVGIPTHGGTGSLNMGDSAVRLTTKNGDIVDTAYVIRKAKNKEYKRAANEQELLKRFLQTRDGTLSPDESITVQELVVEQGMLRRRRDNDLRDIRINAKGTPLTLTLLTSPSPPHYGRIAELIRNQWRELGVDITILIPDTKEKFNDLLLARKYDILLFGQSLLDNLDSYPYWHSSQTQKETDSRKELRLDAYNVSQFSSFESDSLLVSIRETVTEQQRRVLLTELREIIKKEVPAIFLYSPLYLYS